MLTTSLTTPRITPIKRPVCVAVDAFDVAAVQKANDAQTARNQPTDPTRPDMADYEDYFDDTVMIAGESVEVRVCYPNNEGELDAYRLDADLEPTPELVTGDLPRKDYERLFGEMESRSFDRQAEEAATAKSVYRDREYRNQMGK